MSKNLINNLKYTPKRVVLFVASFFIMLTIPATLLASNSTSSSQPEASQQSTASPVCELNNPSLTVDKSLIANGDSKIYRSIDLEAGTYTIRYSSFDDHSNHEAQNQQAEQWQIIGRRNDKKVFESSAVTKDVPENANLISGTLATSIELPAIDQIVFVHAASSNSGPQSVYPACIKFIKEVTPEPIPTTTPTPAPLNKIDLRVGALVDGNGDGDFNKSEEVRAEDTFTWRFVVENEHKNIANNVTASIFSIPNGLTVTGASTEDGSFNAASGTWIIGRLEQHQRAILTVETKVTKADQALFETSDKAVSIQVTGADRMDEDSTPNNGAFDEDDQSNAQVYVAASPTASPEPTPHQNPEPTPAVLNLSCTLLLEQVGISKTVQATVHIQGVDDDSLTTTKFFSFSGSEGFVGSNQSSLTHSYSEYGQQTITVKVVVNGSTYDGSTVCAGSLKTASEEMIVQILGSNDPKPSEPTIVLEPAVILDISGKTLPATGTATYLASALTVVALGGAGFYAFSGKRHLTANLLNK